MERARSVVSLLLVYNKKLSTFDIAQTPEAINAISENLSRYLIIAAKSYQKRGINHSDERYIYEIYGKAILSLLKEYKQLSYIQRKTSLPS
jgi:hypothetical protein